MLDIAYRRFSWRVLKEVGLELVKFQGYLFVIGAAAIAFSAVLLGGGGKGVMQDLIMGAPGGKWGAFGAIMLIVFFLGMFIDWLGILFIMVPIITPIGATLGFDPIWFALMVCINLQMAFMTPPFAAGIFICRGACDPKLGITMGDIIRGVIPHVALILMGLTVFSFFPEIITWLPDQMLEAK